jgi:hypothetical protein
MASGVVTPDGMGNGEETERMLVAVACEQAAIDAAARSAGTMWRNLEDFIAILSWRTRLGAIRGTFPRAIANSIEAAEAS